jgi:hypothetical protein
VFFLCNQTVKQYTQLCTFPRNSPKEARSCQLPEPGGLPRPLFEENSDEEGEKANPGGGGTEYDTLKFPSASYFLGLPLFFFPNKSPLVPPLLITGVVVVVAIVVVFVVVPVVIIIIVVDTPWFVLLLLLNGAGGESVSEFPSDPEAVLSFSSIKAGLNILYVVCLEGFLLFFVWFF